MDNLDDLRNKIDEIDANLVSLFEKRMETVLKVAEYKKVNGIAILNQEIGRAHV